MNVSIMVLIQALNANNPLRANKTRVHPPRIYLCLTELESICDWESLTDNQMNVPCPGGPIVRSALPAKRTL